MRMPVFRRRSNRLRRSNNLRKGETGMKKLIEKNDADQGTGQTVGLDLGDRWSRFCVLDQNGAIVQEDRVRTTLEGLQEQFGGMPATQIVIEAGTQPVISHSTSQRRSP